MRATILAKSPDKRKSLRGVRAKSLIEAVEMRVSVGPAGDCWPWLGTLHSPCSERQWKNPDWVKSTYGVMRYRYQFDYAHRWSYRAFVGQIPDGMTVDHLCFNGICVNPSHLELVSASENSRRYMVNKHWPERRAVEVK